MNFTRQKTGELDTTYRETWKKIFGCDDYEISSKGRIRCGLRQVRPIVCRNGDRRVAIIKNGTIKLWDLKRIYKVHFPTLPSLVPEPLAKGLDASCAPTVVNLLRFTTMPEERIASLFGVQVEDIEQLAALYRDEKGV
jgi:hypothetical protein